MMLSPLFTSIAPQIANHLWQSTLFAAVAGLLVLALRKNQARTRYCVWMAASLKFLVPFSLLVLIGGHLRPHAVPAQARIYYAVDEVSQPFTPDFARPTVAVTAPSTTLPNFTRLLPAIAGTVWVGGFVIVLSVWCVSWRRVSRTIWNAAPICEGRELDTLRRLESAAGVRKPISLMLSPGTMEPGIFGIMSPVLAWPERISRRLDDAQLEVILAHEVCHVRRRDNLTAVIHMLVEAVFWFHPLVWWMGARLVEERERACDEAVLELCNRPGVYAESILKVCKFCSESPLACVSGVTGADLKKRIVQIMTERVVHKLDWGRKVLLTLVGLTVVAVPIVLGQVEAAQRMMAAVLASAPLPIRTAANAMIAEIETPASGEIASIQADAQSIATPDAASTYATPPAFEVASIRPAIKGNNGSMGFDLTPSGRVKVMRETVKGMIHFAYLPNLGSGLVEGGPDWADSDEFDINAKVDDAEVATWGTLSDAQRQDRIRPMVRTLLAERFHLKFHTETQVKPVFALVQAKGGAKLKPVEPPPPHLDPQALEDWTKSAHPPVLPGSFQMSGNIWSGNAVQIGVLMGEIAANARVDRLVVDKTGLTGYYDFTFKASYDKDAPILLDQIEDQLGLKLEPTKLPVEIYVIDSAEKPSVDGAETAPATSLMPVALVQESTTPSTPAAKLFAFDVVTIKPASPGVNPHFGFGLTGYTAAGVPLSVVIWQAYFTRGTAPPDPLVGAPDWLSKEMYDVEAKVGPDDIAEYQKERTQFSQPMVQQMLQAMLADRCKLVVHSVPAEMDGYAVVVDKHGAKLTESAPNEVQPSGSIPLLGGGFIVPYRRGDRPHMSFYAVPMSAFAQHLVGMGRGAVVDHTGLTAKYDFVLTWLSSGPDETHVGAISSDDPDPLSHWDFGALGLRVERIKVPTEKLAIDHIEKPSGN